MAKHLRIITEDKRLEGVKKSKVEDGQVYGGADASVQTNDPETVKFAANHKVDKHDDRVGNTTVPYTQPKIKQAILKPEEKRHGNTLTKATAVYKAANEDFSCNSTEAGVSCPVHEMDACPGVEPKDMAKGKKVLLDKKVKEEVEHIDEVITKKTKAGEIIKDFMKSKDSKFAGKSPKERQKMALGAYYGMHPEKSKMEEDAAEPMLEGGKKKKSCKEDGQIMPAKTDSGVADDAGRIV